MNALPEDLQLSPKDYASDQEVRWCPGCGDYSILKAVQSCLSCLSCLGFDPDETVFISGIGCAARLPYYMKTYGFHTIHGRAAAVATGAKMANPDLDIWVVAGDGDSLSIGTNHLVHLLRRDIDMQYLLINNEIYGLTKGQISPTSKIGQTTPTTPHGNTLNPLQPGALAMGAGATFFARTGDIMQAHMVSMMTRAHDHNGTGLVEILQNCIVYNEDAFDSILHKKLGAANRIMLEHGKPMRFGDDEQFGFVFNSETLGIEVAELGNSPDVSVLIHDETNRNMANLLLNLPPEGFPTPLGVIYCRDQAQAVLTQAVNTTAKARLARLHDIIHHKAIGGNV